MPLRLVTFTVPEGESCPPPAVGLWVGEHVVPVVEAAEACGGVDCDCRMGCWNSVAALLACDQCLAAAHAYAAWFERADEATQRAIAVPFASARLLAPILNPGKLFALAGNYQEHIKESQAHGSIGKVVKSDLATPRVFMKPVANTVCGPGDPIPIRQQNVFVDYEAEMAIIIGKGGRDIPRETALEHVGGVTICNDVSERQFHLWDRPENREWDLFFDWLNGKWFDNFAPMGPCAVPLADIPDIANMAIKLWVNGELRQDGNTNQLIFDIPMLVEWVSHICTLEPGDIISTGTPSGIGKALGKPLRDGDTVEIELEGVGKLTNPVVAA
jgi:2,4-didehydro-3-deoxy-L-rhamnonate hydrolase